MTESEADSASETDVNPVLHFVESGMLQELRNSLPKAHAARLFMLTSPHRSPAFSGPLLLHAIQHDQQHIATFLCDELVRLGGAEEAERCEPTFFALQKRRHSLALALLQRCGLSVNQQRRADKSTLLHAACSLRKPPLAFLRQLLQTRGIDCNRVNAAGFAPIHCVCAFAEGMDGRDAVRLLAAKGAALDLPTADGRQPLHLTRNGYVREALSLSGRPRGLPDAAEADALSTSASALNDSAITGIGPNGFIDVDSLRGPRREVRKGKKLSEEEQEDLVDRLFVQAQKNRAGKADQLMKKYIPEPTRQTLSRAEMEDFATRMYYDPVDNIEAKLEELREKYVTELVQPAQFTEEEMQASVQRLYGDAVEKSRESHTSLVQKYIGGDGSGGSPGNPRAKGRKRCTSAQMKEHVKHMYYDQVAEQKKRAEELMQKYVPPPPPPRSLSPDEVKAVAQRLYTAGK